MDFMPLISAAFFLATTASLILRKRPRGLKAIIFILVFLTALIRIEDNSIAAYISFIAGNLSPTTLVLLAVFLCQNLTNWKLPNNLKKELARLQITVTLIAVILYPTALGFSSIDIYSHGYYPLILTPILAALFGLGIYRGWYYLSGLIMISWTCYQLDTLSSDNLWDYLMDPLLATWCLFNFKHALRWPSSETFEAALVFLVGAFLVFSVIYATVNPATFTLYYIKEDGFIEYTTFFVLIVGCFICSHRLIELWGRRQKRFIFTTTILAILCLFGAGEEVSWGQRIFDIESPNFFLSHNKQQETGLHNLVFTINGIEYSVNKVLFGTGLAVGLCIYLFVMTPLYRTKPSLKSYLDQLGVPMPRNYQILGYLSIVLVVELLVDSSRRGEVTEFTGVIIFLLNLTYPSNARIYDKRIHLSDTTGNT